LLGDGVDQIAAEGLRVRAKRVGQRAEIGRRGLSSGVFLAEVDDEARCGRLGVEGPVRDAPDCGIGRCVVVFVLVWTPGDPGALENVAEFSARRDSGISQGAMHGGPIMLVH